MDRLTDGVLDGLDLLVVACLIVIMLGTLAWSHYNKEEEE